MYKCLGYKLIYIIEDTVNNNMIFNVQQNKNFKKYFVIENKNKINSIEFSFLFTKYNTKYKNIHISQ